MIRSKAVADAGNGFDVTGIYYVRFNGFPQESHRPGNTSVVAALHLPGVFTDLFRGQYDFGIAHKVQQQRKFTGTQDYWLAADLHCTAGWVGENITCPESRNFHSTGITVMVILRVPPQLCIG